MKHLRAFENLDMLRGMNRLLSDEKFQKVSNEFDEIVDYFLEIADSYSLRFSTAYGRKVTMSYKDYLEQNETYQEFIHGLAAIRHQERPKFTAHVSGENNYDELLNLQNKFKSIINRMETSGWSMIELESFLSKAFNSMRLSVEFKKDKPLNI